MIKIMGKFQRIKCKLASSIGKLAKYPLKLGPSQGKGFPGYLYLKLGSYACLRELAKKPKIGSIIITGTNGKTTTTKLTSLLLERDAEISTTLDNNTLNAVVTGLLSGEMDIGLFEYGIRDIRHAIPDTVCKLVDPIGVVYTNISREHSQVAGRKNPFKEYLMAKELLSTPMKRGVVICNADDPRTAYIGKKKGSETRVAYYGLEIDLEDKTPITGDVFCPICQNKLKYQKRYLNHRGIYQCECGFKRPKPNVEVVDLSKKGDKWKIEIRGECYNYTSQEDISPHLELEIPAFGIHNLYNLLCAVTTYLYFTPHPEKIKETVEEVSKNMENFVLPPGRFEILKINQRLIGIGQGDNGDAFKANLQFMEDCPAGGMDFIYTTPDEGEEEIFEDHLNVLISSHPKKIYVFPGRESVEAAAEYFKIMKESFNVDFYPLSNKEMNKKIDKIMGIIDSSQSECIIVSGCGHEYMMWDKLKSRCKSFYKLD
jgi:lipid II isoglutaminyl synthase (glutamine-hydrolysing)